MKQDQVQVAAVMRTHPERRTEYVDPMHKDKGKRVLE